MMQFTTTVPFNKMELIREFHHQQIHFRKQVSTLKVLLAGSENDSKTPTTTTSTIIVEPTTNTSTSNNTTIPSTNNTNFSSTNNDMMPVSPTTGRTKRPTNNHGSRCRSPYKKDSPSKMKTTLAKAAVLKHQDSETSFGSSLYGAESFEQYTELKRVSLDSINKLGTLKNAMENGIKELSNLWEILTEMDEEQPGSLFLMDFEEDGEETTPAFSMSNSQTSSNKVNLRAQRIQICDQITKLINIESTLLNIIESHQNMLENNFGYSLPNNKEDDPTYTKSSSSSNLLPSTKKLASTNFKDIMDYIDFANHIQRTVSCSTLFEKARKLIIPDEQEANEFCAVHGDVTGMTGASPVIRSLPSATFPNNTGTNPNVKWREFIKLEKLNKKFQRKLNEFEGVIVQFVQMKQQYK